jgi:RND family efflux transporter MFP subunit
MIPGANRNWPQFWPVFVLALSGVALYLYSRPADRIPEPNAGAEIPVRTIYARQTTLALTVTAAGKLAPLTQADVVSPFDGKVAEIRFRAGDFVAAGAIVAIVQARDLDQHAGALQASIHAAKKDLGEREAELAAAEKQLAATRELFDRDLIARRDVEQSEMTAETVRAQTELARAHLAQREAMLAQTRALQNLTRLAAPISGKVGAGAMTPGAAVAKGGVILSIVRVDALKLVAGLGGASLLRRGMSARIASSGLPGVIAKGEVVRLEPEKDSEGKNEVEIHVDNSKGLLRSGMAVEASIDLGAKEKVFLVPRAALASDDKGRYVYKLSDGRAVRHPVVTGAVRGDEIAVSQGIEEGDAIITDLKMINPGTRVRPMMR